MINGAPPVELIHLFKSAHDADNHLLRVQRGVVLAQNVNDGKFNGTTHQSACRFVQ